MREQKKAQRPAGIEPSTSMSLGECSIAALQSRPKLYKVINWTFSILSVSNGKHVAIRKMYF